MRAVGRFLFTCSVAEFEAMQEQQDDGGTMQARIAPRLIESLYTEAMLLADEARTYFDEAGREERGTLDPFVRVGFACESLKVTTRIMHIVAWLLTQRAVESGELSRRQAAAPSRRLGEEPESDDSLLPRLPEQARALPGDPNRERAAEGH